VILFDEIEKKPIPMSSTSCCRILEDWGADRFAKPPGQL
jgi:hypothetical protein